MNVVLSATLHSPFDSFLAPNPAGAPKIEVKHLQLIVAYVEPWVAWRPKVPGARWRAARG